ncbi:MAG: hypothetical protein Kow0027_14580 [Saprospiraceae bacterium]|jgi:cytochrome c-type biogenesis protein CcmE|nr:hypothetical protein [Saprospirales bacterium]
MKASEKILEQIRREQLRPKPRWHFVLKNALAWLAFAVAVILGGLAFSVILFAIQQTEFELLDHLNHSGIELFLGLLPLIWLVLLIAALLTSMLSVRHSKRGYKYGILQLTGYSTGLSILLGTLFFISGGAQKIESAFASTVSAYESIQEKKIQLWTLPEEGYLSGTIQELRGDTLRLTDFTGKEWEVIYREANWPPAVLMEPGEQIKLMGEMQNEAVFVASQIRPWGGRRMGGGRQKGY